AKDAIIIVDGITITNDTYTFKDAVQDMPITATRESFDNETAKHSVDFDRESATTLVDELITKNNKFIGQLVFQSRIGKPLNGAST
ncbi:flagellar cap protein, partial [Pseudoalteromonas sp. S185]|uniref:flagellar filament capping protein FliD n=1 Tax=Pseudoalteromonas sp. S185 TaxID=2066522 RepID=UPI00126B68C0